MFPTIKLRVTHGSHKGQELISTELERITIGRSPACTFQLRGTEADMLVSRCHCLINVGDESVEIRDLESRNGTYVNGERLGFPSSQLDREQPKMFKRLLKDGDKILIGASVIRVNIQENSVCSSPMVEESLFPEDCACL